MLIRFEQLLVGDEIIIPSNSNLKYLKVLKLGVKSIKCSLQKGITINGSTKANYQDKENTCQSDINKHNSVFYLQDEGVYKDYWLVKREINE